MFLAMKNRPVLVTWFLFANVGLTYDIQIPKKLSAPTAYFLPWVLFLFLSILLILFDYIISQFYTKQCSEFESYIMLFPLQ